MASLKAKLIYANGNGTPSIGQANFLARRTGYMSLAVFNNKFLDNVAFAYAARARGLRNKDEWGSVGNANYYFATAKKLAQTEDAKAIIINSQATYFFSRVDKNEAEIAKTMIAALKSSIKEPKQNILSKIYWVVCDKLSGASYIG